MKRKLTSILLMSALLVGGASTFVSCKDYDGDQAAVTNAELAKLQEVVTANKAALDAAIAGKQDQLPADVVANLDKLGTAITNAQSAADWVNANSALNTLTGQVEAIAALAGNQEILNKLAEVAVNWGDDMSNVVMRSELLNYVTQEDFNTEIAKCVKIEDLAPYLEMLNGFQTKEALQADVKKIMNDWTNELAENFTSYEDFVQQMSVVPAEIEAINTALENLESKLNIVNNKVAKLVTGINVDMVENPFWGTLNTPFGLKSTVLVGYVGGEINNEKAAVFGDEEGGLAQSATGGSIYLTLNPNDIEAEGMNFTLVGRDGEEAPGYELASLVKDNSKVTTVTTRAAAVNGYKADFALNDGKKAMVNVDKAALKEVASNVLGKIKGQEGLDITGAVQTIYSTFAKAVDQYYALQAAWDEEQLDGSKKTRAVVSDYNIAAVTVKPLGYSSLDAVAGKVPSVPQIPELTAVLGGVVTKIDPVTVGEINGIGELTFSISDYSDQYAYYYDFNTGYWSEGTNYQPTVEVGLNPADGTKFAKIISKVNDATSGRGYVDVDGDGYDDYYHSENTNINRIVTLNVKDYSVYQVKDSNGKIIGAQYYITLGSDGINDLQAQLDGAIAGVTDQVNSMIDKANELAAKFDTKVISRMNRIIKKFNSLVDNAGQYLKPILLAAGKDNNAVRVSEVPGFYTKFQGEGAVTLVPTSYTAELLAPAYKKMIKVDGKDVTESHDGTQKTVVTELTAGKHTITVTTMDYYGEIITKNYYVEIVK